MNHDAVTIQGEFPKGHPLADTHRYAFDLSAPVVEGETIAWPIRNVRVEPLAPGAEHEAKETP